MKYLVFTCPVCGKELKRIFSENDQWYKEQVTKMLKFDAFDHYLQEHTTFIERDEV